MTRVNCGPTSMAQSPGDVEVLEVEVSPLQQEEHP